MAVRKQTPTGSSLLSPWTVLDSSYVVQDKWLKVRSDSVRLPNGSTLSPYYTLEFPDWVNVIALTPEDRVVLVREYRHGARQIMTEFPSGTLDVATEDAMQTMKRELLEETGYAGDAWLHLGTYFANASRQANRIHSFLALDVRKVGEPVLDESECVEAFEMPWSEFMEGFLRGDIQFQAHLYTSLFLLRAHVLKSADPRLLGLRI